MRRSGLVHCQSTCISHTCLCDAGEPYVVDIFAELTWKKRAIFPSLTKKLLSTIKHCVTLDKHSVFV